MLACIRRFKRQGDGDVKLGVLLISMFRTSGMGRASMWDEFLLSLSTVLGAVHARNEVVRRRAGYDSRPAVDCF